MRILGVDWGMKKIGLAVSDGTLASPHGELTIKSLSDGVEKICSCAKTERIDLVVIGLPENKMGQAVKKVRQVLEKKGLRVVTTDETLSTKKALSEMIAMGIKKQSRKDDEHAYAASLILQEYLDDQI